MNKIISCLYKGLFKWRRLNLVKREVEKMIISILIQFLDHYKKEREILTTWQSITAFLLILWTKSIISCAVCKWLFKWRRLNLVIRVVRRLVISIKWERAKNHETSLWPWWRRTTYSCWNWKTNKCYSGNDIPNATKLVRKLDEIFVAFDEVIDNNNLEKIKFVWEV